MRAAAPTSTATVGLAERAAAARTAALMAAPSVTAMSVNTVRTASTSGLAWTACRTASTVARLGRGAEIDRVLPGRAGPYQGIAGRVAELGNDQAGVGRGVGGQDLGTAGVADDGDAGSGR